MVIWQWLRTLGAIVRVNDQHPPAAGRPKRMRRARTASAVAVLLVLAACNGDDDTTPSTRPPITSDTMFVTTTTEPTPSTSQAPTTAGDSSPSTSNVTTPAPTTDPGSSTSAPDLSQDDQAVVDATLVAWEAFKAVLDDPASEDRLADVVATHRGELLDSIVERVQELLINNQRVVDNEEVASVIVPFAESVEIDGDTATVEYCWVDSDILVEVGGSADGTDRIINDVITTYVEREAYQFIDARWFAVASETLETLEGVESCDDRS